MRFPRCSIVIRCYNEEQHIGRLLSGLMKQTIADQLEIVVVDSGSTDATVAIASRYPIKLVTIRPEEFSFGRSLNLGCEAATGEFIAIASAHVYPVYTDWLEQMLLPFENPDIALVYGKQRGNEVTKYSEHQIFAHWFPDQSTTVQHHPFCNNANSVVRRSLWEQFPYDESLTGLEDLDWAERVMRQGYKISYNAEAEIIHVHEETPKRVYNRYRREAIALKQIFPQEKFGLRDFMRLFIGNTISDYFHSFHDGVLLQNVVDIPVFRFMQFWGTRQGYSNRQPVTNHLRQTFYYPRGLTRSMPISQDALPKRAAIDYSQCQPEGSQEEGSPIGPLMERSR